MVQVEFQLYTIYPFIKCMVGNLLHKTWIFVRYLFNKDMYLLTKFGVRISMGTGGGTRLVPCLFLRISWQWSLGNAFFAMCIANGIGVLEKSNREPGFRLLIEAKGLLF